MRCFWLRLHFRPNLVTCAQIAANLILFRQLMLPSNPNGAHFVSFKNLLVVRNVSKFGQFWIECPIKSSFSRHKNLEWLKHHAA